MITEEYIKAYQDFAKIELELTSQYNGKEYAKRMAPYYNGMVDHISKNPKEYMIFKESGVPYYEMEFVEAVEPIRNELVKLANQNGIPSNILFIPRVKIKEGFWDSIININVIKIVRKLFDEATGTDFETLRQFKAFERYSPISKWIKSKNGKKFLYEFQVSDGIRSELLSKIQLTNATWVN